MKILVTGNSGLLGYHLVPLLESLGHEVLGVSRTNRHNHKNVFCTDLTNTDSTEFIFKKFNPDIVYHLAANASEAKGQVSPVDMTKRNLLLTTNVFRSAINCRVKKIIYASSVSVYGSAATPYIEVDTPEPKDIYGVNKLAGEMSLKILSQVYGFDYTILRPHNIYGPGQNVNDLTKNVVNIFMRKIALQEPYTILGGCEVKRAFSYAPDVAAIFAYALGRLHNVTMNVGSTKSTTIEELSDYLQEITGSHLPIERKPLRQQEISEFIADHNKQDFLVDYHETPLKVGLTETWNWMKTETLTKPIQLQEEICLPQ